MSFAVFSDELRVGHEEIDAQHASLFEAVNRLHDAMRAGRSREEQANILAFLRSYTVEHFATEEAFMAKSAYPGLDHHRNEHERLLGQVQDLEAKYAAGSMTLSIMVMHFLKDWLTHHIAEEDRKLVDYLNQA